MELGTYTGILRRWISIFALMFVGTVSHVAQAQVFNKGQTPFELKKALSINQIYESAWHTKTLIAPVGAQPVLETDSFKYLLINGDDFGGFDLNKMHEIISQNFPKDMILVAVTEDTSAIKVKDKFLKWLPAHQLIVASGNDLGDTLWSRDSYPYPVYKDNKKTVELVAHEYFRYFNAKKLIADSVQAQHVNNQNFVYVGGNLMAAENGDCFAVNSGRIFNLSDNTFKNVFYCKTITRLPYVAGIGDVDEVIKTLPNKVILTNQDSYKSLLTSMGYTVVMLPEIPDSYRTYANSFILNKTVFMPSYDDPQDLQAQKVYESFGYKVVQIPSEEFSDNWYGSLHCLTMTYPDMDLATLLRQLGLRQL